VHVVEYGVLGLLALSALAHGARDAWLAPSAALLALTIGILDEALQWFTPARVWDLRDITVNGLAGAGGPLLLAFGVRPAWAQQPASVRGARRFALLLALAWALLGASCLNTSARVARLAQLAPALGFAAQESGMVDYGVLHVLASGAEFPSRLDAETWRTLDRTRAASAGAVLAENVSAAARAPADTQPSLYNQFLAEHSAVRDPFLHELRVHLFRRDRYVETADRHLDDPAWRARDLTVAARENEFLEQHAPETLRAGGLAWSAEQRAERERLAVAGPYRSRVAEGVVTRVRERDVAWLWAAGLAALGFVYARLRRG
ncbi:MAG TPA: VanZ family protein, partial [Myxococcota bacterium]|nr:VanZ family protein [Myxococcota bacterium]